MKLNPDLIRDILLTTEDYCDFKHYLEYRIELNKFDRLKIYNHDEIIYHIRQCQETNLINGVHYYDGGDCIVICDLTPKGHEFLANIRNDNNWNKVKLISKSIGSKSLGALTEIATQVITQLIQNKFI